MYEVAKTQFHQCDIGIFSAAVSDYKPKLAMDHKLKKNGQPLQLELTENPDIAASLGALKTKDQFTVGFALETDNEAFNAKEKLQKKNFDLIVLNSLQDPGAGFLHDTNKITIFDRDNKEESFQLKPKNEVASDIVNAIVQRLHA